MPSGRRGWKWRRGQLASYLNAGARFVSLMIDPSRTIKLLRSYHTHTLPRASLSLSLSLCYLHHTQLREAKNASSVMQAELLSQNNDMALKHSLEFQVMLAHSLVL